MSGIVVRSWGIAGSVQDGGRAGRAWLGAGRGGAVDVAALALANRLVGNDAPSAGIESSGGLAFECTSPTMVAIGGALADVTVEHGPPVGWGSPVVLPAGAVLRIGRLMEGARTYVAVRGGLSGTNATGELQVGPDPGAPAATEAAARRGIDVEVALWPGPRLDWLAPDTWERLLHTVFGVASTGRVGCRLHGDPLRRIREDELPSEGMVEGAVQVPPDGQPIVMLADHPTTGGYPVVAVVDPSDIGIVAQAAPGASVRFRAGRPR